MCCEYCGGDVGETVKLLNNKVSCSACRVVMLVSGRSIFIMRGLPILRPMKPVEMTPNAMEDERILEHINGEEEVLVLC